MISIVGTHNTARVFSDTVDKTAAEQIRALCDMAEFAGARIRIMPDVHAGMGCTIGTTMTIHDKVVPGMVGVDIGCGMEAVELSASEIDLPRLDAAIRQNIPSGRAIRKAPHHYNERIDLSALRCASEVDLTRARRSIGTLGGGNHFIEVGRDELGRLWLVVHSGSRHLGHEVAMFYQNKGFDKLCGVDRETQLALIERLKAQGREKEIADTLKRAKQEQLKNAPVAKDMAWVEGPLLEDYLHDMQLVQQFASINRQAMVEVILEDMGLTAIDCFTTIHNYIDMDSRILRKGAVSAREGERLLIPINMRDGSLICRGLGNEDWNHSAPHGAGRLMSRKEAFNALSLAEFHQQMDGIYTTSVSHKTLDEAPMAYKDGADIIRHIEPTAQIVHRIKPVYNFKASE